MSKGTIWITRSNPRAKRSALAWQKAGFETYVKPLLGIAVPDKMPAPLPENAVLLITSQHALRMLTTFTDYRDWPILTVGEATKKFAQNQGFEDVISAQGTAKDLLELTQEIYDPGDPFEFIYASGSQIQFNLMAHLKRRGYDIRRDIYYKNQIRKKVNLNDAPNITHIALYSGLAAHAVRRHARIIGDATTISISAQTDKALGERFKTNRVIAGEPTEAGMINALMS